MGSVKLQKGDNGMHLTSLKKEGYPHCSSFDEETNNNNQVEADTDSETTHDGSSGSWEHPWVATEKSVTVSKPGIPSYIAKDANSLTFQWDAANDVDAGVYKVQMQQVDVTPESMTPDLDTARMLVDEEEWSVVYSGMECWTQVKSLHPGRYYAVRIRCCIDEQHTSEFSDVVVFHTTPTVPCEPRPPELVGLEHDSMQLEWDAPWEHGGTDITGYRLQLRPSPGLCSKYQEFEDVYVGPELTMHVVGLRPFVKYAARVKAINAVGEGPWSLTSCFKTKPYFPDTPKHISASATSPFTVLLEWSSDWQNGHDRDQYEIEIENVEHRFCRYECSGHEPQHEVTGLDCGQEYCFRVRAENEVGTGAWSSPVSLCLAPCPPSPPSIPFVTSSTQKGVMCAWYPPQRPGGRSMMQYQVEIMSVAPTIFEGCLQSWHVVYTGSKRDCFVKNLVAGCEYLMRVTASNEAGPGMPSLSLQFQAAPGVPLKPFVPHAVERRDRFLRIYWVPPAHDGGKEIEAYRMQICPASQLTNIDEIDPFEEVYEGPRNSRDLTDLMPGTVYAIRVCAVNQIGNSTWSDIGYESTPAGPPLPPQKLRIVDQGMTAVRIEWEAPEADGGAAITGYVVAFAKKTQLAEEINRDIQNQLGDFQEVYEGMLPACSIENLDPSTNYVIKTKTVNEHGDSDWSPVLMVETQAKLPPVPTGLEVVKTTCTSVQLSWDLPSPEVTIGVEMATTNGDWIEKFSGRGQECHIDGLAAGEDFTFRLRAISQNGSSPYSKTISVMTDSRPPTIPEALCVTQITSSTVWIKWTAPEDNGKAVLKYLVETEGVDGALFETEVPASNAFLKIGDLSAQTEYRFRLAAVNAVGVSGWTSAISVMTKAAPPPPPQDIKAHAISTPNVKVDISWSMSDMCGNCTFDVEVYIAAAKKAKSLHTLVDRTTVLHDRCTLCALERGQKYDVRVRATAAGVSGKWSSPVTIRVPEEPSVPIHSKPEIAVEEMETSTPRRTRRGQVFVQPKSKNPLRRRKSVWKALKPYILAFLIVLAFFGLFAVFS